MKRGRVSIGLSNVKYLKRIKAEIAASQRDKRHEAVKTFSMIAFLGGASVVICLFYAMIPATIRGLAIPFFLLGAWLLALNLSNIGVAEFGRDIEPFLAKLKVSQKVSTLGASLCFALFIAGMLFCLMSV